MLYTTRYKRILFSIGIFIALVPLFPQTKFTLDNAIDDFAADFNSKFPNNRSMAIIAFETDKPDLMIHFIDTMVEKILQKSPNAEVEERQRIENLQKEIDFSLTGLVSDETAQRIGHFIGADTVVYGVFKKGNSINEHRMIITATITETGKILSQETYLLRMDSVLARLLGDNSARLLGDNSARLWTLGVSAGSSFSQPLLIGTIHGTIAPFRYSFLELGFDVGFLSRKSDEDYYSISPYAHYAFFWPFDKGGLYAGAGIGYWYSKTSRPDEIFVERKILADAIIGTNILDVLDISYTIRTNFSKVTNKFSVGYSYRFK